MHMGYVLVFILSDITPKETKFEYDTVRGLRLCVRSRLSIIMPA